MIVNHIIPRVRQVLSNLQIEKRKFIEQKINGKYLYDYYETMKILNITPSILKSYRLDGKIKYFQKAENMKIYYEVKSVFDLLKQLKK
jgi:hypothetical protein